MIDGDIEVGTAFLGIGANLGDPIQQILDARSLLYGADSTVSGRCSSLYVSSPVGYSDQPNFVNCVLELQTNLDVFELLRQTQAIENKLGRLRDPGNQNAPRLIDIDILLFNDQDIQHENLVVPHPRMHERLFVMTPLRELIPGIRFNAESDLSGQTLNKLGC